MQNKPIYRRVTVSRWMIATQHLIYGYVFLCACVLDVLYRRQIFPVSCSYVGALLHIKSFGVFTCTYCNGWIEKRECISVHPALACSENNHLFSSLMCWSQYEEAYYQSLLRWINRLPAFQVLAVVVRQLVFSLFYNQDTVFLLCCLLFLWPCSRSNIRQIPRRFPREALGFMWDWPHIEGGGEGGYPATWQQCGDPGAKALTSPLW